MPYMEKADVMVSGSRVASPVEPGLVGTSVTVNVTYELTR